MTNKEFAEFLLPDVEHDWEYYENLYPERDLDDKAIVTRYAPSPTGLPHMGNMFQCFMAQSFARQTNGVFFIRIEDTDTERTVENGISKILDIVHEFGISFDEGVVYVRLHGACQDCAYANNDIKDLVEVILQEEVPGVTEVRLYQEDQY